MGNEMRIPPHSDEDDGWNLSISVRPGEDTNRDSLISGERSRSSPTSKR